MGVHHPPIDHNILNSPEEVRKKLKAVLASRIVLRKAEKQVEIWLREYDLALERFNFAEKELADILGRYDSESNTLKPDEKMELSCDLNI